MTDSPDRGALPRFHLVTDDAVLRGPGFGALAERLLEDGRSAIALHIRAPASSGREVWRCAEHCARIARRTGTPLLVNDRVDVALGCGAAGVQLGRASFPVPTARDLLGGGPWIGASVHDPEEAQQVAVEGADFLLAGTLFGSTSHPGRPSTGVGWLRRLEGLGLPVIGIGGITPGRVAAVLSAGAHGVAVISGVWRAARPSEALRAYLGELSAPG